MKIKEISKIDMIRFPQVEVKYNKRRIEEETQIGVMIH